MRINRHINRQKIDGQLDRCIHIYGALFAKPTRARSLNCVAGANATADSKKTWIFKSIFQNQPQKKKKLAN